ncbi:AraC family transcriptional regulator [Sphingobacterium sp. UT-1RO-CII-1]|uniref:helix-turn-helix domain-containing protein n=1 Tax=Sphingobacterium sp. UT-1RO-CII-1 TaxID=2995225 RepID=UPI00227B73A7|nr:AraC family transcriptional regulator [Sphingobacterium sp. UT-1RO-CII-1]MCY4779451.1 AraC family transcriptional regulator [Sphingobacterium sp. UT-1RO-CII-1]
MEFIFLYSSTIITTFLSIYLYFILPVVGRFDKIVFVFLIVTVLHYSNAFIFIELLEGYQYVEKASPFELLYGPLFFLSYLTTKEKRLNTEVFFYHGLPFIIFLTIYFVFLASPTFRVEYSVLYYRLLHLSMVCSMAYYGFNVLYKGVAMRFFPNSISRYTLVLFFIFVSLLVSVVTLGLLAQDNIGSDVFYLLKFLLLFITVLLSYMYFLGRVRLLNKGGVLESNEVTIENKIANKKAVLIKKKIASKHLRQIENYMKGHPYLRADFKQEQMAMELGLPKYVLSKYFIEVHSGGFLKVINGLRIDYACKMLEDEELLYTMDELAVLCGFSSRASFYRNFSNQENCTPMEYRERLMTLVN